ncbi:hypothetical protein FG111_01740 [Lactobacillus kunkeei]|uniref:hypothetical protein n=1 Tax=Apilactobacillus kunkeei TaxID=148814 RepID=UPI001363E0BA|nr:hypothetical protein [Apilactobacillus kunkeei]NBI00313.1 hypothetical protein [Apilactobacillus kunkeei]
MDFSFYGMISPLLYLILAGIISLVYKKIFIVAIRKYNYFGYIIGTKQSIENEMNSLKPSEVKNLINELSIFKFSSFITYVGFIIALLSFIISQFSNTPLRSYIGMTILILSVIIILGSFFTWIKYNECVLYAKEYFYENFDENTYKLKNNIKKP